MNNHLTLATVKRHKAFRKFWRENRAILFGIVIVIAAIIVTANVALAASVTENEENSIVAGASAAMNDALQEAMNQDYNSVAGASSALQDSLKNSLQKAEEATDYYGIGESRKLEYEKEKKEQDEAAAKKKAEEEEKAKAEAEAKEAAASQFGYLADEEYLLAQILECEVGSCGWSDKVATGSVVLNRIRTTYKDFRDIHTIHGVLYQGGQYATATKTKIANGCVPSQECLDVAHGLITGEISCLQEKILYQTSYWMSWMSGCVGDAGLGLSEFYGYPLDFESGCL